MDAPSRIATVAVRQLTILMALGLLASFWLPWVHLDGQQTPSTGIGLVATLGAPSWDYMMSVSLASAGALIGGPVVIGLFGIIVLARYARRRTAIFSTVVLAGVSIGLPFGASGLLAYSMPASLIGLRLIAGLAVLLLLHQVLIKVYFQLHSKHKFQRLQQALATATGIARERDT